METLAAEAGGPVADKQNSETAGNGGPVLLQDQRLLEKLAHFDRERVPARVVRARGATPTPQPVSGAPMTTRIPRTPRTTTSCLRQADADLGKRLEAAVQALRA